MHNQGLIEQAADNVKKAVPDRNADGVTQAMVDKLVSSVCDKMFTFQALSEWDNAPKRDQRLPKLEKKEEFGDGNKIIVLCEILGGFLGEETAKQARKSASDVFHSQKVVELALTVLKELGELVPRALV